MKKKIVDLSNINSKKSSKNSFNIYKKQQKKKNFIYKIRIISKRFVKTKIHGIFDFLILLKIDKYVSVLKLGLLLLPLFLVSILSNFIIAIVLTGLNAIVCSILYIIFENILLKNRNKFWKDKIIHKKKKILAVLIICFVNIVSIYFSIHYRMQIADILIGHHT